MGNETNCHRHSMQIEEEFVLVNSFQQSVIHDLLNKQYDRAYSIRLRMVCSNKCTSSDECDLWRFMFLNNFCHDLHF